MSHRNGNSSSAQLGGDPALDDGVVLSSAVSTPRQRRLAGLVAVGFLVAIVVVGPFAAAQPVGEMWAFLPVYQLALIAFTLLTAVLLLFQTVLVPSWGMLILAGGYLFSAEMAVAHALSFPGLVSPAGLLGGGMQTTAWLYFLWHGGFPLFIGLYAGFAPVSPGLCRPAALFAAMLAVLLGVIALGVALPLLVTVWHDRWPSLMVDATDLPLKLPVAAGVELIGLVVLLRLAWRRPWSQLDLWLMVVVWAWIAEGALAALLNHARFDLGWYAGRVFGLAAAGLLLMVLLLESGDLYLRLIRLRMAERTQSAAQLQASESRFEATFEHAAVGLALVGLDGRWLHVNRKLCVILGYPREELRLLTFQDITFPDDLTIDLARMEQLLAGERDSYQIEKRYVRKDGDLVWANLTVALIRRSDGGPHYFVSAVEDISARKTVEAALQESQERLQLLIDHAPAALAMFDREMRILAVSRRWLDDFALTGQEVLGQSLYRLLPGIGPEPRVRHRRGLAGEVIRVDEDRLVQADGGECWLRSEIRPWRSAEGGIGGVVIFSEDITRLVEARNRILELNDSLEQRVRARTAELTAANRELDAFAYAVSHDLRAPLRAMSGLSVALIEDFAAALPAEARDDLEQIDLAARRMGALIDGILTLSRTTRGEVRREPVDLSDLAAALCADLTRAEPGRGVGWQVAPGLRAEGDPRMIESLLRNLLENAWKYTSRATAPTVRVFAGRIDGLSGICVADNGAGFDMAHAARLFQPFQRLHREEEFPGIGIGLATVQRIVQRHGGEIRVEARPGAGATFCFTLSPALTEQPAG